MNKAAFTKSVIDSEHLAFSVTKSAKKTYLPFAGCGLLFLRETVARALTCDSIKLWLAFSPRS